MPEEEARLNSEKSGQIDETQPPVDWFLQSLVEMANDGLPIPITLQVGGFLVSGIMSDGASYFEAFASDFTASFTNSETIETFKRIFGRHAETYRTNQENPDPDPPSFIHLKEARFYQNAGNPIPTDRPVWWRGRISSISGFVLGQLLSERERS